MRNYEIVSTDSHLEVPPYRWEPFVDAEFREYCPKVVQLPGGGDAWLMPGKAQPVPLGLNFSAGRGWENLKTSGLSYADGLVGAGDAKQRLAEMDADGIDAELLFPAVSGQRTLDVARDPRRGLRRGRARVQRLALAGLHRRGPRPAPRARHPPGRDHRRRDRRARTRGHDAGHPWRRAAPLAERVGGPRARRGRPLLAPGDRARRAAHRARELRRWRGGRTGRAGAGRAVGRLAPELRADDARCSRRRRRTAGR